MEKPDVVVESVIAEKFEDGYYILLPDGTIMQASNKSEALKLIKKWAKKRATKLKAVHVVKLTWQ